MLDAVLARCRPRLFNGRVPTAFPAPTKSFRFPRLRDFNLSQSSRVARSEYKIRRGTLPVERHSPLRVHSPERTECESSESGSFKALCTVFSPFSEKFEGRPLVRR